MFVASFKSELSHTIKSSTFPSYLNLWKYCASARSLFDVVFIGVVVAVVLEVKEFMHEVRQHLMASPITHSQTAVVRTSHSGNAFDFPEFE